MIFAHDANLGFLVNNSNWIEFFQRYSVNPRPYIDMAKLTKNMKANTIEMCFLPAGNYFYFRDDSLYEPVASALFAANQTTENSCVLVVSSSSDIENLSQLKGKTLSYIHAYCTSSYFAPAILLRKNHFSIHDFFGKLVQVEAWQAQIDAVISHQVDATMVQEDIWHKNPQNDSQTKIIARLDKLPSPLVIISKSSEEKFKEEFTSLLISSHPEISPSTLFSGFVPYQKKQLEAFYSSSQQAFAK